jgi:hypothetical protein
MICSLLAICGLLAACSEQWPEDGREWIENRLTRGPSSLDCYESNWNERQGIEFPPPSILDGQSCPFDMENASWAVTTTAVNAITRCEAAGYTFEFSVTQFSRDHYYSQPGNHGYYCEYAAARDGTDLPALGQMTSRGTALDGEFSPLEMAAPSD